MLKATVSGSFHRHMIPIYETVNELRTLGAKVLSPSDPRVVDNLGDFLFVASDKLRSIRLVQDRHMAAIRESDFLWVVCPDGYTGPSTCLEIGTALASGVPVFASAPALDITIGEYVRRVASVAEALTITSKKREQSKPPSSVLIDPPRIIEQTIDDLSALRPALMGHLGDRGKDVERQYKETRRRLAWTFSL